MTHAMLRILQVCNVGQITGGTAACAWTITRSLPWAHHTIAFLSPISGDTREAFRPAQLLRWEHIDAQEVARHQPDLVLLHNTAQGRADPLPAFTVQYLHSRIVPAPADLTLACSHWLADQYPALKPIVLHQAVPIPPDVAAANADPRPLLSTRRSIENDAPLTIGRLCTPQARKWPAEIADFYRRLAAQFPRVEWEFVGCPDSLQALFRRACGNRAAFHDAGWEARAHLHRWHALLYHHPTLTESFGRTCAEALRAGCIPLVDNRGGFREQIDRSSPNGFLCDSPDEFAAAIELLHDPERRRQLSDTARRYGNQRFSLKQFAEELLQLVKRAAATSTARGL